MNRFRSIREQLGLTQAAMAQGIGVSQGNVSLYERGQQLPPRVAARLIKLAAERGVRLTFDDVYAHLATTDAEQAGTDTPPTTAADTTEASHAA